MPLQIFRNEIDFEAGTVLGQDTASSVHQETAVCRMLPDPDTVVLRDSTEFTPPEGLEIPEMGDEEDERDSQNDQAVCVPSFKVFHLLGI
jgi:hypothetical protein